MATQFGVTGVASFGVAVVAVENVTKGHDPFPQLLVGGLFVAGCSVISEFDTGLGMAVAATFLVSVLILHSKGITDVLGKIVKQNPTPVVNNTEKGTRNV